MTHLKELRWTFSGIFCLLAFCAGSYAQTSLNAASGPAKKNIAVINLKNGSGVTAGESELISDRLRGDLFNTDKVNVMERDQMQEILKEQGFQAVRRLHGRGMSRANGTAFGRAIARHRLPRQSGFDVSGQCAHDRRENREDRKSRVGRCKRRN